MSIAGSLWQNAVLARELQVRLRSWRSAGIVMFYVGALAAVTVTILLQEYVPTADDPPHLGVQIFDAVAIVQLLLICALTPLSLAGALSRERQRGTWELLLLTRLTPLGIAGGKILAGIAFNLLLLVAALPFYTLAFLFGDVSPARALPVFAVFVATVALLAAVALLISALTSRPVVSLIAGTVTALLLTVVLFYWALHRAAPDAAAPFGLTYDPSQFAYASPLTPLAHLDPLFALLSALPSTSGGTLLADLGTVHHAFGLGMTVPLWQAYLPLAVILSMVLVIGTSRLVRVDPPRKAWRRRS